MRSPSVVIALAFSTVVVVAVMVAYQWARTDWKYRDISTVKSVKVGMRMNEVRAKMGDPAAHGTNCWQYVLPYQLRVCYSKDDRVTGIGVFLPEKYR